MWLCGDQTPQRQMLIKTGTAGEVKREKNSLKLFLPFKTSEFLSFMNLMIPFHLTLRKGWLVRKWPDTFSWHKALRNFDESLKRNDVDTSFISHSIAILSLGYWPPDMTLLGCSWSCLNKSSTSPELLHSSRRSTENCLHLRLMFKYSSFNCSKRRKWQFMKLLLGDFGSFPQSLFCPLVFVLSSQMFSPR